jgi:hypothetical protein
LVPVTYGRKAQAAAFVDPETNRIHISNSPTSSNDFWLTLSVITHEYGHWLDNRFGLGFKEEMEIRAYKFQIRDHYFDRAPKWFQDKVREQLETEENLFNCKEVAKC